MKSEKMIILQMNKFLQLFIGLQSFGRDSHLGYIIAPIFLTISMLLLFLTLYMNIILNIHNDFDKAWPSLPAIFPGLTCLLVYWHLLSNRTRFYSLFDDMEDIMNKSACNYYFGNGFWLGYFKSNHCRDDDYE